MKPYYERDGITIYQGDCRAVLPTLGAVDHVITDPPYSEQTHAKQWVAHALTAGGSKRFPSTWTGIGFEALSAEVRDAVAALIASTRRWTLVFSDLESAGLWRASLVANGQEFIRTGIWTKPDAAPQFTGDRPGSGAEAITICHAQGGKRWNGGGKRAVFDHMINNYGREERLHPTPKPLPLMRELTELFTDPGETILDPFCGSGTTLVAAYQLGRKAIGIELEEKWCEVTIKRLEAQTPPLFTMPAEKPVQATLEVAP